MNNCNFIGRLTKDPEIKTTKENKSVVNINIAINNRKDDTTFLNLILFSQTATLTHKYCKKGDLIGVSCIVKNNNWEDKTGNKHYDYTFIGNRVTFLSNKSNSINELKETEKTSKNESYDDTQIFADFGDSIEISDEDIAF